MCAHPAVALALGGLLLFLSTIQRCVKESLVNQGACPLELKSLDVFHLCFSSPWVPEGLPLARLPGFPRAGGAAPFLGLARGALWWLFAVQEHPGPCCGERDSHGADSCGEKGQ